MESSSDTTQNVGTKNVRSDMSGNIEYQTPPSETTRLLPKQQPPSAGDDSPDIENEDKSSKSRARVLLREFWLQLRSAVPVSLAYMLQNSMQAVSVLIVGRISPEALATASFAYMFAMATGFLIALGGTTAMDTIASATFTASNNPHDLGVVLQRAFFVLGLFYIPVVVIWFASEPIFIGLRQQPYIAHDASRFLWVLAPGGLGYVYFECMKKYLQAQEMMRPGTYVLFITAPLNAVLNYLFVHVWGLGLLGAPFATGICYWASFLLLVAYVRFFSPSARSHWGGFSLRAMVHNSGRFARLAALGIIHVGTEWWAFEIVSIVAGMLGTIDLAAQSVIQTSDQVLNTIPFGVGVAASARVGNLLGARDATGAKRAAYVAGWLSVLLGAIVLAILMGVKDVFGKMFNDDQRIVDLVAHVMPYVALFQVADGMVGSGGGILRGQGRQHIGAIINVVAYYCAALPLGIWMAFNGWRLEGLWIGQCCALYLVGIIQWAVILFSSWNKQVRNALKRLDRDMTEDEEPSS